MPRKTLKLFGAILRCVVLECLCLFSNVDLAALQLILTCTPHRRTWLWLGIKKTWKKTNKRNVLQKCCYSKKKHLNMSNMHYSYFRKKWNQIQNRNVLLLSIIIRRCVCRFQNSVLFSKQNSIVALKSLCKLFRLLTGLTSNLWD